MKVRTAYMDHLVEAMSSYRKRGENIIHYADKLLNAEQNPLTRINNVIGELDIVYRQ